MLIKVQDRLLTKAHFCAILSGSLQIGRDTIFRVLAIHAEWRRHFFKALKPSFGGRNAETEKITREEA